MYDVLNITVMTAAADDVPFEGSDQPAVFVFVASASLWLAHALFGLKSRALGGAVERVAAGDKYATRHLTMGNASERRMAKAARHRTAGRRTRIRLRRSGRRSVRRAQKEEAFQDAALLHVTEYARTALRRRGA